MAKYTPSALVGELSGSLGSETFSHNLGGPYIRTRVNPDETASTARTRARTNYGLAAAAWTAHISLIRSDLWDLFAAQWIRKSPLGRNYRMTGRDAYISINTTRFNFGQARIDFPPAFLGWPYLDLLEMEADTSSGGQFWPEFTPSPIGAGNRMVIAATKPLRQTQKSFDQAYRVISFTAANFASATNQWANYLAAGYSAPVDGNLVSMRLRLVNASFMVGPEYFVQAVFSH